MADVSKQYIISFLASLQGDKLVVSGLKQIDSATKRVTTTTKTATKTTDNYSVAMGRIAKRALLTVQYGSYSEVLCLELYELLLKWLEQIYS